MIVKKSLLNTNPYLKDASQRERALTRNVETSSAIEGIRVKRDAATGRFVARKSDISTPVSKKDR